MSVTWGIHKVDPEVDFIEDGVIAIGWHSDGDIRKLGARREDIRDALAHNHPDDNPNAIPIWAGMLFRFAYEMQVGDTVVYPDKSDRTVNIGRIVGDYEWHDNAVELPSRRKVEWLRTAVPRTEISRPARNEIGSALTLFRVRRHEAEFLDLIGAGGPREVPANVDASADVESAVTGAEEVVTPSRVEEDTRDFIIDTLMRRLDGIAFEGFVADVLGAMGYRTRLTEITGDGGVDIVAHRDALAIEPPIIKVQCKRTTSTISNSTVNQLLGAIAPGSSELALFVTLGSYSRDALALARTRPELRLISGNDLADLVLEHYDRLPPSRQRLLPLRRLWVVDDPGVSSVS